MQIRHWVRGKIKTSLPVTPYWVAEQRSDITSINATSTSADTPKGFYKLREQVLQKNVFNYKNKSDEKKTSYCGRTAAATAVRMVVLKLIPSGHAVYPSINKVTLVNRSQSTMVARAMRNSSGSFVSASTNFFCRINRASDTVVTMENEHIKTGLKGRYILQPAFARSRGD